MILSDKLKVNNNKNVIDIKPETTEKFGIGANNIKIFAISNSVLRPDFYESSFLVTENIEKLPSISSSEIKFTEKKSNYEFWIIPIIIIIGIIILKKRHSKP